MRRRVLFWLQRINFHGRQTRVKPTAPQSCLRKLRDANRGDRLLVKRCNDVIAMIKNLKKIEGREFPGATEAAIDLRKNLAVAMTWLEDWGRRQPATAPYITVKGTAHVGQSDNQDRCG